MNNNLNINHQTNDDLQKLSENDTIKNPQNESSLKEAVNSVTTEIITEKIKENNTESTIKESNTENGTEPSSKNINDTKTEPILNENEKKTTDENSNTSINSTDDPLITKENQLTKLNEKPYEDQKNEEEEEEELGKKKIIIKLNDNNSNGTTPSDVQNNILELEIEQLNNIEQIRFIIKVANSHHDQYFMRYGLISKYVFCSKYHILHVNQHVRLPSHFIEGNVRANEIKGSINLINTQRKRHLYTMAILNNSNIVNIMDIDGSSNVNHVLTVKLKEKLTDYVLLENIGHYAACSNHSCDIEVNIYIKIIKNTST